MALTPEAYARQLEQLLPPGAAWNLEADSLLSQLLLGIADEYARIDQRGAALQEEADPRSTLEMLADWERVLGLPDPCVIGEQSMAQRRAAVVARYTSLGTPTPAYFITLAQTLGYAVTITEFTPHDVDDDVETSIYGESWAYAWQVNAPTESVGEYSVEDPVSEPLAWWGNAALECVFTRVKPSHTMVIFSYTAAPAGPRYMLLLALTSH